MKPTSAARQLLGAEPVLGAQVLGRVAALGAERRVELERLETQLDGNVLADALERAFERGQADGAPGARHVGNEFDLHVVTSVERAGDPSGRAARHP